MQRNLASRKVPGEVGLWSLIIPDLLIFSLLFVTFLNYRRGDVVLFSRSSATLDETLGLANTMLLLSSSLIVAIAVDRVRKGRRGAALLFAIALSCGIGFVAIKLLEYWYKLAAGINPETNSFFMFYFILTGIHLFHVLAGLAILLTLTIIATRPDAPQRLALIEGGACLWHVVDLLWIGLFAILYLVR